FRMPAKSDWETAAMVRFPGCVPDSHLGHPALAASLVLMAAFLPQVTVSAEDSVLTPAAPAATEAALPMPVLRRLTRSEYGNTLHDIFGIDFPFTEELPADGQVEGFDNNAEGLSLSPLLL